MLQDEEDENDEKAFVIGKGLTKKGILQLASMLANMTIGDLEALLDLNNIDASVVHQIITDLTSLATELVRYIGTVISEIAKVVKFAFRYIPIYMQFNFITIKQCALINLLKLLLVKSWYTCVRFTGDVRIKVSLYAW